MKLVRRPEVERPIAILNPGEVAPTHYLYEVAWGIS
jgi:hypothetical protein